MGPVNTIDKFGRRGGGVGATLSVRGQPGVGFKLTAENHYDIQGKCLKNVREPEAGGDAATRSFVVKRISENFKEIKQLVGSIQTMITTMMQQSNSTKEKIETYEQSIVDIRKSVEDTVSLNNILNMRVAELEQRILSSQNVNIPRYPPK